MCSAMATTEKTLPPPPSTTLRERVYASYQKTQGLFTTEQDAKTSRTRKIIVYAVIGAILAVGTYVNLASVGITTDANALFLLPFSCSTIVDAFRWVVIVVGAVVGTKKSGSSSGSGGSSGGTSGTSSFPLDPKLHNSFWGCVFSLVLY